VKFYCEERPLRFDGQVAPVWTGIRLDGDGDSVFLCGHCGAESQPVRHDVVVATLAGLVDQDKKRLRVSVSALPVRPL
jgi:hypothetical protein